MPTVFDDPTFLAKEASFLRCLDRMAPGKLVSVYCSMPLDNDRSIGQARITLQGTGVQLLAAAYLILRSIADETGTSVEDLLARISAIEPSLKASKQETPPTA